MSPTRTSRTTRRSIQALIGSLVVILSLTTTTLSASAHTKISHSNATSQLSAAGITWSSSGNCSDRYNSSCTSFEQINQETISGIKTLKSISGCSINATGGTEVGHASGTYSHWNGYKIDISKYTCVGSYIRNNFSYIGGYKYKSASGNIYYDEGNHWDITYYTCGC